VVTDPQVPRTGIGQALKSARQARDLTLQDVSDSLNLLVRVVEDMEAENWGRLPSATFTRGYLRAYAKLLEIDAHQMLQGFDEVATQAQAHPVLQSLPPPRLSIGTLIQKQPGAVLSVAVVLVACTVLVVLWAVWPDAVDTSGRPVVAPLPAGAVDRSVIDAAPAAQPSVVGAAAAEEVAAAPTTDDTANGDAAPVATDDGAVRRISATGDDRLEFVFAEDSWVEVKDRGGRRVFADLGRAGKSLQLIGQAPFAIVLGNAPGVDLSFNGEHVVLSPHTRNNIATLARGQ
jgi:cytoskeleton protein RodZ